jgi:hypothetical protein
MAESSEWLGVGLLVAALLLVAGTIGGAASPSPEPHSSPSSHVVSENPQLVELRDGDRLWPYTSRSQLFASRTLAINIVVYAPPETTRRVIAEQTNIEWIPANNTTDTDAETRVEIDERGEIAWSDAEGAVRYSYVETAGGEGVWLTERYQLHDGRYLGARDHVRAYGTNSGGWTAMQVHSEYWDWFRLRHSVSGTADAQRRVEAEFMNVRFVDDVARSYYDNGGAADSDGWVTVVSLNGRLAAIGAVIVGAALPAGGAIRDQFDSIGVGEATELLAPLVGPGALYLGIRVGGIALETPVAIAGVSPKVIAGILYPVMALGVPATAFRFSRRHARVSAFGLVAAGLGAAFLVDYLLLGVDVLSLRAFVYRVTVILSAATIAAGGAEERDREIAAIGGVCWLATLVTPLLGVV